MRWQEGSIEIVRAEMTSGRIEVDIGKSFWYPNAWRGANETDYDQTGDERLITLGFLAVQTEPN